MKVRLFILKLMAGAFIGLAFLVGIAFASTIQGGDVSPSDPAAFYKAKCAACHGQKAEKKYDATIAEDQQLETVLKGKKVEKPPNMPGFEAKGVTADQARALVTYMKQLKESASAP